jgi:hypothetical protein
VPFNFTISPEFFGLNGRFSMAPVLGPLIIEQHRLNDQAAKTKHWQARCFYKDMRLGFDTYYSIDPIEATAKTSEDG